MKPTTIESSARGALWAWAMLLLPGLLAAQEAENFGFGEIINVQLVNVEVWVTDRQDRPVNGLTADDFEILEDGKPVVISHFAEVREDRPVALSFERSPRAKLRTAADTRTPTIEPGHLVLYFDQLHLRPASRNRLIEDVRDFLVAEKVAPERVLILSQDESLHTLATFGSSWPELDEALARLAKTAPVGGRVASEKRLAIRSLQEEWRLAQERVAATGSPTPGDVEAACEAFLPRAVAEIEAFARETRQRIAISLDHLASVSSFLTGVPGVKTMLYVSDALERAPGADLVAFIRNLCPAQQGAPLLMLSNELGSDFERLTRHANANRVTIYSLQALGLQSSVTAGADQGSIDFLGAGAFDLASRNNERDGMSMLAAETGGRAVFNRNDFDVELGRIADEMSAYYSLAYEPPHGGDQGEHRIEVRPKSKDLRARYRRGYQDKSPDQRMTERLEAAVYLGLVANPLEVRLAAGTLQESEGNRLMLPLHVLVPTEKIAFLPSGDEWVAQLSLQVSTRDTKTLKGIFEQRAYRVPKPSDPAQEVVGLLLRLEVPPGVHVVAVGLRDDATLESSFVSTTLELNASAKATGST